MLTTIWAKYRAGLLGVLALAGAPFFSGCDEHITVDRDPSVSIQKGMTWAWRAAPEEKKKLLSRDVITRNPDIDNDIVRNRLKSAIEGTLASKGLAQVADAAAADFLVDYHVGIEQRQARVATPVNRPVLVCGYYGCWNSWNWGYWGAPEVMLRTVRYREGTIVFDLVRRSDNRLGFRAIGQKEVRRDSVRQDEINSSVKHLLKDLKPGQ